MSIDAFDSTQGSDSTSNCPDTSDIRIKPARKWRFTVQHEADGYAWIWARFAGDGGLEETSGPQPQYREALLDAITHGCRPGEDCLTVDLAFGTVHFPSGRQPVYIGHGFSPPQRRNGRQA